MYNINCFIDNTIILESNEGWHLQQNADSIVSDMRGTHSDNDFCIDMTDDNCANIKENTLNTTWTVPTLNNNVLNCMLSFCFFNSL